MTAIQKLHEQNANIFLAIQSPQDLCKFLGVRFSELIKIINHPHYINYEIKKKKGGIRKINNPETRLKIIQKKLNYYLQAHYLCIKPQPVFGFVINPTYLGSTCNIVENARPHINKKHILNIDIKDFFSSISAKRVKKCFDSQLFNFSNEISTALTLLLTYQAKLPTGAPTSPIISNFVCYELDLELVDFCHQNNLTYTRYADDLTFSSSQKISNETLKDIINILKNTNFDINTKKLRFKSSNQKQTVTGLIVNEKVNVDRKFFKNTRAMLHDAVENGVKVAATKHFKCLEINEKQCKTFVNKLHGNIDFIGQVRGKSDKNYLMFKNQFKNMIFN